MSITILFCIIGTIFLPTLQCRMDALLQIAEKTSGRDKLCRLVQYGSKTVSSIMELKGASADLVKKIKSLEAFISTARKLFRLGKSIDSFLAALQTIHLTNPVQRLLVTLTKISRGFYLLVDHLIWASRMNLVSIDDKFWARLSNRFWLVALFLSLLRDFYELLVAIRLEKKRLNQYSPSLTQNTHRALVGNVIHANPALVIDSVKNVADLWIPVSRLDLIYLPNGIVGLLGVVSSLAGLMGAHDQRWRLKFS